AAPAAFGAYTLPVAASRVATYLVLAAFLVTIAIWFGVRRAGPPAAQAPPSAAASSAIPAPSARPEPAPADANASAPNAAATPGTSTPPQSAAPAAPAPSAVAAAAPDARCDIVVASFRTEARATSVAAEVA